MSRKLLIGLGVFGGIFLLLKKNQGAEQLGGLGDARHQLYTMPRKWWIRDPNRGEKNCYQNKAEALMRFADFNSRVIENYSGISHEESPAEFDAMNSKHGLSGNRAIVNIAQALWVAMPPGRPYCLTNMDTATLNETSPGREALENLGIGFEVPDFAIIDQQNREQMEIFKQEESERRTSRPVVRRPTSQEEVPF